MAVLIVCMSIAGMGLAVITDSDAIIELEDAADCDNATVYDDAIVCDDATACNDTIVCNDGIDPANVNNAGKPSDRDNDVEAFLADYDIMWEILDENYYYFPYMEKQGVDVEALKRSTRQQLESRITDIDGFYYLLESMFRKLQNFAHLSVVEPAAYAVYRKYYDSEDDPAASDNGWKRALQNPKTGIVYEYLEKTGIANKMTGAGQTRDQMTEQEIFPSVAASYDADRQAVLFKISSFDDRICERDKYFIEEYLTSLGSVPIRHIIFDLSGNGGGNDFYWQENIVAPFGGSYEWNSWCYLRDTPMTRDYFFQDFHPEPVGSISGHDVPAAVTELGLTHYFVIPHRLSSDAVLKEEALNARRWVIVDDRVYSSADSFSAFCRETGWATVAGRTTRGDGKGVSPVLVTLPETGLLIRFSGLAVESPDGTLNAITGTRPDIQVNPKTESAFDVIDEVIGKEDNTDEKRS